MKNKERRYRMSDSQARELGITPNKTKRYRLRKSQEDKFLGRNIKRLFFDIETSPMIVYSWRIGYKINLKPHDIIQDAKIICISYKWEHSESVFRLTWDKDQNDRDMLSTFIKIANKADELVAQNGDYFDVRWLRGRAMYHRLPMFPKYRTLDTYKKAKQAAYLPSYSLNDMGRYFKVGVKAETGGFDLWKDVMGGDKDALKRMCDYCDQDVILLEDVYHVLQPYIKTNTNVSVHTGGGKYGCPNCGENHNIKLFKNDVTPKGSIRRIMECEQCGYVYDIANVHYRHFLERW